MKYRYIYFDNDNQKIKWTQSAPENLAPSYNYIGESSRVEFDLLIELLWYKYEDANIDINELKKIYVELRTFCDSIKESFNL